MALYKATNSKLALIREVPIKLEKNIQALAENNLGEVFGVEFVASEFIVENQRIDTLAFDPETKSFVIIEYKRDRSFSIVDQGFSYLALMLDNKADFILEYNQKHKQTLGKNDIDWSQSRIIFVANSFSTHQYNAMNLKDMPFALWEVKRFENNLIAFSKIRATNQNESIKNIVNNEAVKRVSKEVHQYSVEDHFKKGYEKTKELYEALTERILELDPNIEINPTKSYVGYKIGNKNVLAVWIHKSKLSLNLPRVMPKDIKDPDGRVRYQPKSHDMYNKHVSLFDFDSIDDVDYAMFLSRQVYEKFINNEI